MTAAPLLGIASAASASNPASADCSKVTAQVSNVGTKASWHLKNPNSIGCKVYVSTFKAPEGWDGYRADTTAYPQSVYHTGAVTLNPGQTKSASLQIPSCGPWATYATDSPPPSPIEYPGIPSLSGSFRMGGAHTTCDPVPVTGAYEGTLTAFCGGATAAFSVDAKNSLPVTFETSQAGTLNNETLTEQPGQSDMSIIYVPSNSGTHTVNLVATEGSQHRVLQVVQVSSTCP